MASGVQQGASSRHDEAGMVTRCSVAKLRCHQEARAGKRRGPPCSPHSHGATPAPLTAANPPTSPPGAALAARMEKGRKHARSRGPFQLNKKARKGPLVGRMESQAGRGRKDVAQYPDKGAARE